MPIYEYECTECDHRFDKLVKMGAEDPPCGECAKPTRRLISAAAFVLKGGGWASEGYGQRNRVVPGSPSVSADSLPYVTQDGGLASSDGKKILNSDGSAV